MRYETRAENYNKNEIEPRKSFLVEILDKMNEDANKNYKNKMEIYRIKKKVEIYEMELMRKFFNEEMKRQIDDLKNELNSKSEDLKNSGKSKKNGFNKTNKFHL